MSTKVEIGSESGYLFREATGDNVCFVPERFVTFVDEGTARIDWTGYLSSGWSLRNRRWMDRPGFGAHALPDPAQLVDARTDAAVQAQVRRFQQLLGVQSAN